MWTGSRRDFLLAGAATATLLATRNLPSLAGPPPATEVPPGARAEQAKGVEVLYPRNRVPIGFIIDDSTCLVNMGAFCMPQFKSAWPGNPIYRKPWQNWPREIPNDFVREFGEFCAEQGVRGKYSMVPYPACVGWLDRDLPGWSRKDLQDSLKLMRELMMPNWDLTPEMITHTRAIDIKTGRPIDGFNAATMENSYPPVKKSADELAAYIAYALKILKNCEIPCQGVTTPGGFGNQCKSELSQAMGEALRDVNSVEIPHYFKYISEGKESSRPVLEHVEGLNSDHPTLTVNVPASTGDWFGSWDGDQPPMGEKYINEDGTAGRMVELIEKNEPAIMFGHWAGFFCNGSKKGFEQCKKVITTLNAKYRDKTIWMKTSELARYWAARELTGIERSGGRIVLNASFACPAYTVRTQRTAATPPQLTSNGKVLPLTEAKTVRDLSSGQWFKEQNENGIIVCFELAKGRTTLDV
jgi:hypothetical protein